MVNQQELDEAHFKKMYLKYKIKYLNLKSPSATRPGTELPPIRPLGTMSSSNMNKPPGPRGFKSVSSTKSKKFDPKGSESPKWFKDIIENSISYLHLMVNLINKNFRNKDLEKIKIGDKKNPSLFDEYLKNLRLSYYILLDIKDQKKDDKLQLIFEQFTNDEKPFGYFKLEKLDLNKFRYINLKGVEKILNSGKSRITDNDTIKLINTLFKKLQYIQSKIQVTKKITRESNKNKKVFYRFAFPRMAVFFKIPNTEEYFDETKRENLIKYLMESIDKLIGSLAMSYFDIAKQILSRIARIQTIKNIELNQEELDRSYLTKIKINRMQTNGTNVQYEMVGDGDGDSKLDTFRKNIKLIEIGLKNELLMSIPTLTEVKEMKSQKDQLGAMVKYKISLQSIKMPFNEFLSKDIKDIPGQTNDEKITLMDEISELIDKKILEDYNKYEKEKMKKGFKNMNISETTDTNNSDKGKNGNTTKGGEIVQVEDCDFDCTESSNVKPSKKRDITQVESSVDLSMIGLGMKTDDEDQMEAEKVDDGNRSKIARFIYNRKN